MSGAGKRVVTFPGMSPRGAEMWRAGTRSGVHLPRVGGSVDWQSEHKDGVRLLCMCCCSNGEIDWGLALVYNGQFS